MRAVFVLAVAFWATGSLVCYSFAALAAFVKADAATVAPPLRASAPWTSKLCLVAGLLLGLLNAYIPRVGFAALARRDTDRIHRLGEAARWHNFFPKCGLITVMCVAMSCAVTENLTQEYWVSVLSFTVLLSCVGTGLCCGAIAVATGARQGADPPLLERRSTSTSSPSTIVPAEVAPSSEG